MAKENTNIVVCGKKFDCGARVVLWDEQEGLSFYPGGPSIKGHYTERNLNLKELSGLINAFYVHHSVTYTAHSMFRGLKARNLSCNFMIDDDINEDGCATIYQLLDVKDAGYTQGGIYNRNGAGVEIAYYPDAWSNPDRYSKVNQEKWGVQPHSIVSDTIHGHEFKKVFGPTEAQVKACIRLIYGYSKAFPNLELSFPRDKDGKFISGLVPENQRKGLLHHFNVKRAKVDAMGFPTNFVELEVNKLVEADKVEKAKPLTYKIVEAAKGVIEILRPNYNSIIKK